MSEEEAINQILDGDDSKAIRGLFAFDHSDSNEVVIFKFNLWIKWGFSRYFTCDDAPFHETIDQDNLLVYRGQATSFLDIAFRDAAKTARTKLFLAFVITNDNEHFRQYFKILSEDGDNSKQIVTDIFNMLISPKVTKHWPEIFEKTDSKREERMESFTTATRVKVVAGTVGDDQRGALADENRPDFIWYEDFENRSTLRSRRKTLVIWDNMEEARTGLAKGGGVVYTCNYISEQGNVDRLVKQPANPKRLVLITSILTKQNQPAWPAKHTLADIEEMRENDDDFEGERMCKPSAAKDIFFDREKLEQQVAHTLIREIAGFKIFHAYNPSHRYGSGHDVSGGVGLDSSTSVFIDFDTFPARVVATFASNNIRPDNFGDEIARESDMFGRPIAGIETNNHGHATIARSRQLDVNLYAREGKATTIDQTAPLREYGWHTNALTKPMMLFALGKAIEDGLIEISDPELLAELMAFTRNDLMDKSPDPRLATRHFDLLVALAIAWQMKDHATVAKAKDDFVFEEEVPLYPEIGI